MGDPQRLANQASLPFNLTDVDRKVLLQTDDEFVFHDWADLRNIIATNNLEVFRRKPSDLLRYIAWTSDIKAQYGSITNYICKERLHWPLDPSKDPTSQCRNPIPFADPSDFKILRNDWPYGFTPDITHLVVWLKNSIPVNAENGDLTSESRALIDRFIRQSFVARLEKLFPDAEDRVMWFKNWTALQSVRSVEHVHVLVRDVPDEIIVEWTGESRRS
ncbi:hypothetical protein PAAG_00152 [Paracoccidioides lutzii Pb01]|uniref:N-acetylglucosamine-induced protein 1 n=1 Tax=Paracoccidioides lutzii (strain ATCC MYA-826 / Pb01) TaxID=502779 RepID=C1GNQ7_PARBA|nr:hypothetical protein PAAG_00152 [Paracoccidioides lutzii Pb01]EEH35829.1 hypothetical protein PAAG_00152 [Paracoccidioides lutzii Pb01]